MKRTSMLFTISISLILSYTFFSLATMAEIQPQRKKIQVVYGKDDRLEVYQLSDPAMTVAASSSAAMFLKTSFQAQNQFLKLIAKSYGETRELCKDEPYFSQPNGSVCSAFLVAPDVVVTTGHCIAESDCPNYVFVFNYKMDGPGKNPELLPKSEVYSCRKILAREQDADLDYAIVRLDREVVGHVPATLSSMPARRGDPLVSIGNPAGLPTKVAGGATVRRDKIGYFVSNLDGYGGSSGSAVYNADSGLVVGMLFRGEEDFKFDFSHDCNRTYTCSDASCRGEDVLHIDIISAVLKQVL